MSGERVLELETEIRRHSELYYNGTPEVTDAEFDELVEELTELEPGSPALAEVGAAPAWGRKVKHPSMMGSLEKVNEVADLRAWYDGLEAVDELAPKYLLAAPKIDGLAIRLRYAKGELVEAATRGDGEVGQDVLENARRIRTIPQKVDRGFSGEVRGEVYMRKDVWEGFGKQFANPRNGAAGGLLQKDPAETERRTLDFLAYSLKADNVCGGSEVQFAGRAKVLGFDYVELEHVDPVHLEAYLLEWENERRAKLPFQIDGLVFSLNAMAEQEEAGWNGKRPRGKMAWKFKPEQREATVLGVTWQVGRTGKLTPVLHIEPTRIDGSTVSNVSLASAARFEELGLGRGDKVMVEKAGDIIPQVVRVTWRPLRSPKMEAPEACPCCGSTAAREGANVFCRNPACPSQLRRRVLHWLDRMDVKGVGPGIAAAMCDLDIVRELSDLYYMKAEDLEVATGSRKVADNIINELGRKSQAPFWKFLAALGVPSLGRTASKAIAKRYSTVAEVVEADVAGLSAIEGIGETTATSIVDGLIAMARDVEALEKVLEIEEPATGGPLAGKSFCLTGAMSRGRKEIAADIEAAGGEVKSSVGKGLSYLVQADPSSASSKTKKAEKHGVEVISEESLMEMIG